MSVYLDKQEVYKKTWNKSSDNVSKKLFNLNLPRRCCDCGCYGIKSRPKNDTILHGIHIVNGQTHLPPPFFLLTSIPIYLSLSPSFSPRVWRTRCLLTNSPWRKRLAKRDRAFASPSNYPLYSNMQPTERVGAVILQGLDTSNTLKCYGKPPCKHHRHHLVHAFFSNILILYKWVCVLEYVHLWTLQTEKRKLNNGLKASERGFGLNRVASEGFLFPRGRDGAHQGEADCEKGAVARYWTLHNPRPKSTVEPARGEMRGGERVEEWGKQLGDGGGWCEVGTMLASSVLPHTDLLIFWRSVWAIYGIYEIWHAPVSLPGLHAVFDMVCWV